MSASPPNSSLDESIRIPIDAKFRLFSGASSSFVFSSPYSMGLIPKQLPLQALPSLKPLNWKPKHWRLF